ncbi:hypothetical protein WICANDRAFT_35292 [Wickerhamomyces anomalus NRRL Y-366-8]|uniref:C2H2-type domain-containing protein n=1 Tax=Wickerhamomyces anomalus (strain ATCC 58044 / CBS 1984 / NCYC 433 / NRRL Y-366-8) TaxID=683960 RepID=A0A1E3NWQ7_WICAA|nr:uncharacterized protein WICANDRAFT_35292 [Wickerhamomyces anomalus NRRL Y-366-8]ODQ57578.1 hypothetical protein WICANDRAFT_35292 [Wickerhamomyces anomalus NRRL Y-366-8]
MIKNVSNNSTAAVFKCPTCGKSYSRKDFLARHQLNHKNIRPFKCETCDLSFTRRDMLSKHCKSHSHQKMVEQKAKATTNNIEEDVDNNKVDQYQTSSEAVSPATFNEPNNENIDTNSLDESPKEFLSLLDMSGGFIDNLLWLFTDNFPEEMLNENNLVSHPESAVIDVDATTKFDIAPASYNVTDAHTHMFGSKRFKINETTRLKILEIFSDLESLKNVSLSRLDEYMDLYWFNFAQTFPIIHQVTFDPNKADIYLLISILIIGMAHTADRLEYELSIQINKNFRRRIKDVIDEDTQLSLPIMQALILHNFSAKNFGDTKLTQMSQIDHGSNLLYLKFSGFLENLSAEPVIHKSKDSTSEELYEQWQKWIYYETSKRTVFFEYICDTQHITFNRAELSQFDIKSELPCSDQVWNASTPEEFFAAYQIQPNSLVTRPKLNIHANDTTDNLQKHRTRPTRPVLGKWPTFLWTLKSFMTEYRENQREFSLNCYSLFSRYIILHSLIRVCWHARGHGLLDLGIISQNRLNEFFNKLELAFANWKGYFDLHIKLYDDQLNTVDPKKGQVLLNNYGPTNACWANLSFFYVGLFTLYADITSLSKFATEYNKPLSTKFHQDLKELEHERNIVLVEQWARSSNAEIAVIEACKYFTLVYKHEETINTYSHVPPSVLIATMIIWCFEKKNCFYDLERKLKIGSREQLNLKPSKYFDRRGDIIHSLAREQAHNYCELIAKQANDRDDDSQTDDDGKDVKSLKIQKIKEYKKRQEYTVGVVCYGLDLIRHCKWPHSIDIVEKLEHIVKSYD